MSRVTPTPPDFSPSSSPSRGGLAGSPGRGEDLLRWFGPVGRLVLSLWQVPAGVDRALQLEWRLVSIRWIALVLVIPVVPLAQLPIERTIAAYLVLLATVILNASYRYLILHRSPLLAGGLLTSAGDFVLHIAMIVIGGGFNTPFYFITFTITISFSMRYGYGPSLAAVFFVFTLDSLEHAITGYPVDAWFAFRSIFLLLSCILSSYLREQASRAENALQIRLRDANLLNAATAQLGASLEFGPLLQAVAAAGARLFRSQHAVLEFFGGAASDGDASPEPTVIHCPDQDETDDPDEALWVDLLGLCQRYRAEWALLEDQRHSVTQDTLPCGAQAVAVAFAFPTHHRTWATLACELPSDGHCPDPDILDSFAERVALAMENASLYWALTSRSDDLQRAYADLATAHRDLLRLDEMKDSFLANVSHELRTPLSSIRSFSELLLSYDDRAVQKEFLEIINSESERLTRMVSDVLDVLKIESGNMDWNMAMVDPVLLVNDLARTFGPLVRMQQIGFDLSAPEHLPPVYGDRDRLEQVLANLLNNAMKFTETGRITLSAASADGEVQISVADTGIGIAEADAERVFEKFQQVGGTLTGKPRGSGLGLAICQEIIEHHDGRIWVESTLGVGSTFTIALNVPLEYPRGPSNGEGLLESKQAPALEAKNAASP